MTNDKKPMESMQGLERTFLDDFTNDKISLNIKKIYKAGVKTVGGSISNLRYGGDTTLMTESEEEL